MNVSAWEAIFMLVVLKIPLIYLGAVVWWAVRATPEAELGGEDEPIGALAPLSPCSWNDWQRRRSRRPGRKPVPHRGRIAARVGVS